MTKSIIGRKIKVGLLGCGRISKNHLEVINNLSDDLILEGVCDQDVNNAKIIADKYDTKYFSSYAELLKKDIDLVSVCTPSGLHPEHCIAAARAGKHVVTEKPMATNWEDGLSMVDECDKNDINLFVVKQNRFNHPIQCLHRAIKEKRFGKIYLVGVNVFWTRPQSYYDLNTWRGTWKLDGGAFMNQASHYLDLLVWLFGSIDSVSAMTSTLARKIEAEDTGVINIKWKSGTLGSVAVTMLTYPKNLEGSIVVMGEHGTVKVGGIALNTIEHWDFATSKEYDADIIDSGYSTKSVYGKGHFEYYKNVIQVLRGESAAATSGHEALKSLELLISAYRSASEGKTIYLPLEV